MLPARRRQGAQRGECIVKQMPTLGINVSRPHALCKASRVVPPQPRPFVEGPFEHREQGGPPRLSRLGRGVRLLRMVSQETGLQMGPYIFYRCRALWHLLPQDFH
jgi:hypothetical protein